ncbi:hypothetical protein [Sphingopyxis sp.]|uniref:hypothetical protein n=1 Tax=Sphingopyxis sp. TaxID=1908224 RepID=UPI003D0FD7BC
MRTLALAALLLASGGAQAMQRPEVPVMSDDEIQATMKAGEEVENRVNGDFNGDGDIDTAWIVRGEDSRALHVQFAARGEYDMYHEPAGSADLDPFPLGPAEMTVSKGVLVVKDLTGGTTAISATYRFRGEKMKPKMRLIGLDATLYSRTYAHDGAEMSWNVLTGDVIATKMKLIGSGENANYDKSAVKRFKRPVRAYYMEDTPDAEETLDMAMKGK